MSADPITFGMAGLSVFNAGQSYAAGKEQQAQYAAQSAEIGMETAYAQRLALEQMKQLNQEGRTLQGEVVARAGKSGLRVGGSVSTLSQAIARKIEQRKAMLGFEFNETARRNRFEQEQLRIAGKKARRAGTIGAFGSLLTGGLDIARRKEKFGYKTWYDTFFTENRPKQV